MICLPCKTFSSSPSTPAPFTAVNVLWLASVKLHIKEMMFSASAKRCLRDCICSSVRDCAADEFEDKMESIVFETCDTQLGRDRGS